MNKEDIEWKKESHWATEKWYSTIYFDWASRIFKQVDVHRDSNGFATNKTRQTFFVEGESTEYKTIEDLLEVYNKKVKIKGND